MSGCGPGHEFGTFSSRVNDLHYEGILQIIRARDCLVTWSANLHNIKPGFQVYDTFLEELLEGHGDTVTDEHHFSSIDKWSVEEDHTGFRRHAAGLLPGFQG